MNMQAQEKIDYQLVPTGTTGAELVESWIFSVSGRSFSIYSERLILRMVQLAQAQLLGVSFKDGTAVGQVSFDSLGVHLRVPIKSLLSDGDTNYTAAKRAVVELMHSPYFVERPKLRAGKPVVDADGNREYELIGHQILNDVELNVVPGAACITVNANTWAALLDFSKGFRKYDLETALKLRKSSSLRLYKLLCNRSEPITISIESLRKMWQMDERDPVTGEYLKYADTYDFVRRVIVPAKEELDARAPWSFEFVLNAAKTSEENRGRRGKKAVTSITFFPVHRFTLEPESKLVRLTSSALRELGRETYDLMKSKLDFTDKGLSNNVGLFHEANRLGMDIDAFVRLVTPAAVRSDNPPGYVISSMKRHLGECHGVLFDAEGRIVRADSGE